MNTAAKALGVLVVIIPLSCMTVGAQGKASDAVSKEQLQRLYSEYLTEEGYKPEVDADGDVRFKREGRLYFIAVSEQDPGFFRLVLPNVWPIENEAERSKVLAAADYSNAKTKVCKVFIVKKHVWLSVELFFASPRDFKGVFSRAMAAIDTGVVKFAEKMRE